MTVASTVYETEISNCASAQDRPNPRLWLATRAGKKGIPRPFGITRYFRHNLSIRPPFFASPPTLPSKNLTLRIIIMRGRQTILKHIAKELKVRLPDIPFPSHPIPAPAGKEEQSKSSFIGFLQTTTAVRAKRHIINDRNLQTSGLVLKSSALAAQSKYLRANSWMEHYEWNDVCTFVYYFHTLSTWRSCSPK